MSLTPATKLRQGNVFTPVCHSVQGGSLSRVSLCPGGSLSRWGVSFQMGGLCPGGSLRENPPPPIWQQAGGTHPTGMHSCIGFFPLYPSGGSKISPRWGVPTLPGGGTPTYDFAKFSQKLHEIERIWTAGGARPHRSAIVPCSGALSFGNVNIHILLFNGAENLSGTIDNQNRNSQLTRTDIHCFRSHVLDTRKQPTHS